MSSRAELRRELRRKRRSLPPALRRHHERVIARALLRSWRIQRRQRIAVYLAADGEADLGPCLGRLWRRGRTCFLPTLQGAGLQFRRYTPDTPLVPNRFGIPEPRAGTGPGLRPRHLDLVLLPLVAFDGQGNRLGMGGGYYDRSFAHRRHRCHWQRPLLVGVAYALQEVEALGARPWDVPLDGVVTEEGLRWFPRRPCGG